VLAVANRLATRGFDYKIFRLVRDDVLEARAE